ncbi:MAG: peptidase S8 and S53 subtilisin kexin sedolisin, partial [Meiothermus sp.]
AVALYLYQRGHLNHPLPQGNALESVRKCLQNATQHPWQAETGYGLVDVAKVVDPANPACY